MMYQRRLLLLAVLAVLSLAAVPEQQRSVTYQRYDVDIDVQADGSLIVTEIYQLRFEGEFRTGFAEIPRDYVTDIVDVQVREGEDVFEERGSGPGTFTVDRNLDAIRVEWEYEPTSGTEVRTFAVEYQVLGGLWVYPARNTLAWTAVPADRSGVPTEASRVTVHLPSPVDPNEVTTESEGVDALVEMVSPQRIAFSSEGGIPEGTAFEIIITFPHDLTDARVPLWQRQIDERQTSYRWEAFTVDLMIAGDGSLEVTERQTLAVDEGYLYSGYRVIPWLYLDQITNPVVRSDERTFEFSNVACDYCYVVEERPGQDSWVVFDGRQVVIDEDRVDSTLVEWAFPVLETGTSETFELSYNVLGAVRVLTDAQQINWTAVFADRDAPVAAASLDLHLPPDLNPADVTVSGGTTTQQSDDVIRVTHDGSVPAGQTWSLSVRLPSDATTSSKPIWQEELEQELEREEAHLKARQRQAVRRARWQVGLGAVGCLFPILGLAGVVAAWYVWGRDRAAPIVASYLPEPPSDLPPGIVAYLVDEKPTVKGALADLLHLSSLGLISVDLRKTDFTVRLNWTREIDKGEVVRVVDDEDVVLAEYERTLFNMLVRRIHQITEDVEEENKRKSSSIPFSKIETTLTRTLPVIYEQMGEMASQYFSTLPKRARRRWSWAGQRVVVAAGLLALVGLCGTSRFGLVGWAPSLGLAAVGLMLMGVSRWMPQRTTLGIEEAARWRAFRRYLKNLKQFGDVEAAQAVLDRYFPYAVALDVDEIVLKQAERMNARVPIWMVPTPVDVAGKTRKPTWEKRRLRDRVPGELLNPPVTNGTPRAVKVRPSLSDRPEGANVSLQGLSDHLAGSLNRASRSLSTVLNTAVGDVDNVDSPFEVVVRGAGTARRLSWKAGATTMKVLGDILEESSSGGGGGGFSGGGFRSSSWSSRSSSSRSSGGPSFGSRRSGGSGGGGSRGFG